MKKEPIFGALHVWILVLSIQLIKMKNGELSQILFSFLKTLRKHLYNVMKFHHNMLRYVRYSCQTYICLYKDNKCDNEWHLSKCNSMNLSIIGLNNTDYMLYILGNIISTDWVYHLHLIQKSIVWVRFLAKQFFLVSTPRFQIESTS
jgi:hypothetical protein